MNIDQALRDAAEVVPSRVGQPSSQALLDRIVSTSTVVAPRRRRRTLVAVVAAAVAAGAALILPNLGAGAAYASWSPDARPLAGGALVEQCAAQIGGDWLPGSPERARAGRLILGEQRGDYAYLSMGTADWVASCFQDRDGQVHAGSIFMAPVGAAKLGRQGVELQAMGQLKTAEGYCRLLAGQVGSAVVGVDVVVGERTVHATVANGSFLAWYPERIDQTGTTLTLRLADGRTIPGLATRDLHDAPVLD